MLRKLVQYKPEALEDARSLSLTVGLAGITGEFVLPEASIPKVPSTSVQHFVWIAGGIGVTPFLSMLSALSNSPTPRSPYDITLVVSTNEPDVMVSLLEAALGPEESWAELSIHIFTNAVLPLRESALTISRHRGRLRPSFFAERRHLFEQTNTEIYLCGPQSYEDYVLDSLSTFGIDRGSVHREGFAY
ncbi:hypothetical protein HYPSUDRAFT_527910 [Hypholoma sublateritium FD-334 SS-4]|uniref:Oxidoreductase FAD/NAD(P)-binding domain-containing protein n=1 Tax=Hypholoma sublateritium (strain FD-334 SS-4) TaxID=945553 RepID=A0A0D2P6V1_HYPSF|nr:hypothetical protein HYPSUDRAFT_527910 [Hypholoma sublateritium FD-334 SS-4]